MFKGQNFILACFVIALVSYKCVAQTTTTAADTTTTTTGNYFNVNFKALL